MRITIKLGLALTLLFYCSQVKGQQTITWDKAGNGFWDVAANWNPAQVPTHLDTVIITHDSIAIRAGVQAQAARVEVGTLFETCGLGIVMGGSLTISGSSQSGIVIQGDQSTFQNEGLLQISQFELSAIVLKQRTLFDNTMSGIIEITSPSNSASINISTSSNFINSGQISIDSNSTGIDNIGDLINHGEITIKHSEDFCLLNLGNVHNYGSMHFDSITSTGIWTSDSLTNHAAGVISLSNSNLIFLNNLGDLINHGQLEFSNSVGSAVSNSGTLLNFSQLLMNSTGGIDNNRDLINGDTGFIQIDSSSQEGLHSMSLFVNGGTIEILRTEREGINNRGYLQNDGEIVIKYVHDQFNGGLYNQDSMQNNGRLSISHCANHGFYNKGIKPVFINNDSIYIDSVGESGLRSVDGTVDNKNWIQITNGINVGSDGIVIDRSTFENCGFIRIDGVSQVGLGAFSIQPGTESILNLTGGEINIGNVTETGINLFNQSRMILLDSAILRTSSMYGDALNIELGAILESTGVLDINN